MAEPAVHVAGGDLRCGVRRYTRFELANGRGPFAPAHVWNVSLGGLGRHRRHTQWRVLWRGHPIGFAAHPWRTGSGHHRRRRISHGPKGPRCYGSQGGGDIFGGWRRGQCALSYAVRTDTGEFALAFGPPELFWVNLFGLVSVSVLISGNPTKGLISTCFGILVAMVGVEQVTGQDRFTFGILELGNGIDLVVVLVGLYALPPAWRMAEQAIMTGIASKELKFKGKSRMKDWPWLEILPAWLRASIIGIIAGVLPGVGGIIGGFVAYGQVKRASKDPDSFGKGNPVGIATAECANNADNAASMIPTLTLGIPGSGFAALVLAALMVHGLHPGPDLFKASGDIVYGYMWAMLFTSVMLIFVGGLMFSKLFANLLRLPQVLLSPLVIALVVVGIYGLQNSMFDVYLAFIFGIFGYCMEKLKFPMAPVILGLVLGSKVEFTYKTSLLLGFGDHSILWSRPICQVLIALIVLMLISPLFKKVWQCWKDKNGVS